MILNFFGDKDEILSVVLHVVEKSKVNPLILNFAKQEKIKHKNEFN